MSIGGALWFAPELLIDKERGPIIAMHSASRQLSSEECIKTRVAEEWRFMPDVVYSVWRFVIRLSGRSITQNADHAAKRSVSSLSRLVPFIQFEVIRVLLQQT